ESYQQQNSTATITSIDKRPVQQNAASYHIQLGSFGNEQNAINFQRSMANRLQQPTEVKYDKGLYRVYIGNYPTREEAGYAAFSLPVSTTVIHF
ncbi:SPOR domain-containing protein, partial [Tsukamurella conjunctivitidis]